MVRPETIRSNDLIHDCDLVSRNSDSSHKSRAGHPSSTPTRLPRWGPRGWLRCSSLTYSRYARSSRLAIRAPRSGTYATNHCYGTLALRRKWPVSLSTGMVSTNQQDIDERREVHVDP